MAGKWREDRTADLDGQGWIVDEVEDRRLAGRPDSVELHRGFVRGSVARRARASGDGDAGWRPEPTRTIRERAGEPSPGSRPGSIRDRNGSRGKGPNGPFELDREVSLRDSASEDQIGRIGRRGHLRPELLVLVVGGLFVVAALLKPWPNLPKSAASPQPSGAVALAPGDSTATPLLTLPSPPEPAPTVNIWALIPPYNYRPGQWPPPTSQPAPGSESPPAITAWTPVNWAFLSARDPHTSWGVSALTLPAQGPTNGPLTPATSWAQEVAPWSPSTLSVPRGSSVFGIALTWPAGLEVKSVTFDYLSLVSPRVGVTPLPAEAVATPAVTPAPTPRQVKGQVTGLSSGSFWIPPSSDLVSPTPSSLQAAWQSSPWSWPIGEYRASLDTNAGKMIVVLDLQPA